MQNGRFTIGFTDFSKIEGDIFLGGWLKLPIKPIKSVSFYFLNKVVRMEDFEEYNILVERASMVNGNGKTCVIKVFIVGRERSHSVLYEYDLIKMRVFKRIKCKFSEFENMQTTGWKKGVVNKIAESDCL